MVENKLCSKCNKLKSLDLFFTRIRNSKLSYHAECKDCTKGAKKQWAINNAPYTRSYARKYYEINSEVQKDSHRQWSKGKRGTKFYRRYLDPIKVSARKKVAYALKTGKLKKLPCSVCGVDRVEAHHENYNKPLEIVWLCKQHHGFLSRKDKSC